MIQVLLTHTAPTSEVLKTAQQMNASGFLAIKRALQGDGMLVGCPFQNSDERFFQFVDSIERLISWGVKCHFSEIFDNGDRQEVDLQFMRKLAQAGREIMQETDELIDLEVAAAEAEEID